MLSEPGRFRATRRFDCRLSLLPSAKPLKHRAPVHFHAGTAEIEAQASSQDYAEYGIIIRLKSENDVLSYYIFGVSTDGKYYLSKKLDGKWQTDPVKSTSSGAIKQGTNKNKLRDARTQCERTSNGRWGI